MRQTGRHIQWYALLLGSLLLGMTAVKGLHGLWGHSHAMAAVACDGSHDTAAHWHDLGHVSDDCGLCDAYFMPYQGVTVVSWYLSKIQKPRTAVVFSPSSFTQMAYSDTALRGPPFLIFSLV